MGPFYPASDFRPRLQSALWHVGQIIPMDLSCLQVWMPAMNQTGLDALQKQLYSDPELFIIGNPALMPFRLSSCQSMQVGHQGMPGRVLRSGCVQVVQNLRIIPEVLHPRCRLPEPVAAGAVGEVVYIPVFDLHNPHVGPVAVLEALLSATATDSMLVANFISVAGSVLACLQLSLSNPLPQPVRRSKLEGRKPRPVHPDSSADLAGNGGAQQQQQLAASTASLPADVGTCQHQQQQAPHHHHHQQQQPAGMAGGLTVDTQQHQQPISCSTGSAGTVVAVASASTPCSSPAECTLSSTLSSRLWDACTAQAGPAAVGPDTPASGAMLPPRPCVAGLARPQHRRRWQQDCDPADGSEDGGASPPPCKLRRTLSMVRTKSVPMGLDQVLAEALPGCEPTASC